MRHVLTLLLALGLTTAAFAEDAVAGKTHVLVGSPQNAFWVSLDTGAVQQIYPGYGGTGSTVATDGERFLVANGAQAISLFEEGGLQPLTTVELDLAADAHRSYATWDAARNRYLVAYIDQDETVSIAALTRDGALINTVQLGRVQNVSGLVANGDRILLLEQLALPVAAPTARVLRARILDPELTIRQTTLLGEIPDFFVVDGASFQRVANAIPFGTGFYVAWHQGTTSWGNRNDDTRVVGTRITALGEALDVRERFESDVRFVEGRTLLVGVPEAFDTDLVNAGGYVVAVTKRENYITKAPLTATFVAPDGVTLGSRQVARVDLQDSRFSQLEVVRLRDGRTLAVSVVHFTTVELIPLDTTLPKPPRRRAVR